MMGADYEKLPTKGGPLAEHGAAIIDNGYEIIPIAVGKKAPGFDGWSKIRSTKQQLNEWIGNGHRNSGVGILTKHTPGIDLDIRDENVSAEAEAKVREIFGDAPLRIGEAPKRLMLFRTDTPFKKMRSTKYVDEWGQFHQIEILCDGQQFVAYHIHPDTKKPYAWPSEDGPLVTPASDLIAITEEKCQELIDWFEERAQQESDWKVASRARSTMLGAIDSDNPFIEDTASVDISEDDLRNKLMLVAGADDYHVWNPVGMALYHQFDGEDVGKEMWNEWSETADNHDRDAIDRHWDSFSIDGKKRAPLTARFILRLAKEAIEETAQALSMSLNDAFANATTLAEWEKARVMAREAEIDGLSRSALASAAKDKRDKLTGTKTPLTEIKKAIAFQPAKGERTPGWAAPWIYDTSDDRFFSTETKSSTSVQGFNAMYDRKAMTKKDVLDGKSSPSSSASALALNLYKIPTVDGRRYEPGRDPLFHAPDGHFANTYPEHEIPELPEKLLPRDKRNIERVKKHITHLLSSEDEQNMLLDWLSWVVQNPGKHVNYAILLQGVEGDGKSFFAMLLRAVMGVSNVSMMNAHILESSFTDWSVGQCVNCIEEVLLVKHNKYEIINRIKPYITNPVIEVHPKGGKQYNAKNTTSYLLFSNSRSALPIDDDGRRFNVLFSQWQHREKLIEFMDENPDYYEKLYNTLDESAPALREWLLNHEQTTAFKPYGGAPQTNARKYMIRQAQPEFIQAVSDVIQDGTHDLISEDLVSLKELLWLFDYRRVEIPSPKTINNMMSRSGFEALGRVWCEDEMVAFFSKNPEKFQKISENGIEIDAESVREYVRNSKKNAKDGPEWGSEDEI